MFFGARGELGSVTEAGTAGQDHGLGRELQKSLFRQLERRDLAIDAGLAHPARDQLRHLRAEIDNEHLVVMLAEVVLQGGHGAVP